MMESLANKEARSQEEKGLTLEELEGQTAGLLPNRLEMHRHHHRGSVVVNNISKCNGDLINLNVIASQCN
jgi:hypothetical protein